jgi:hypothetical protein
MNPMEIQEEEMLRKERENQKDLEDTIGLVNFISKRDLVNRGRNVTPSGKQWKEVQSIAATLRCGKKSKSKSAHDSFDMDTPSFNVNEFDLLSKGTCMKMTCVIVIAVHILNNIMLRNKQCRSFACPQWTSEQTRP